MKSSFFRFSVLTVFLLLVACSRPWAQAEPWAAPPAGEILQQVTQLPTQTARIIVQPAAATPTLRPTLPPTPPPGTPFLSPTPDAPHRIPTLRTKEERYTVRQGDSLAQIARRFQVDVPLIQDANDLQNANLLRPGQVLVIPTPPPGSQAPSFKIIPDSELVAGPKTAGFSVENFVISKGGYLASYTEEVDDVVETGAAIVERVSKEYSVSPRLLLAVLEHQSGWVTKSRPSDDLRDYPVGYYDSYRKGLYRQLAWAANNLNRGYYLWRAGAVSTWILPDGSVVPANPSVNAGTAGVQHLFGLLYPRSTWEKIVNSGGFSATFKGLFSNPFMYSFEPVLPAGLKQPKMQLPFEKGAIWSMTSGPHGGWNDGSAWAALDFAPPGEALGCRLSNSWVVAVADGVIVRSENGAVIQDLDGDGIEQTGWTVFYMHIDSNGRVQQGKLVKAGEKIGHPSCEGGVSTGTHLHLARKYNGEWIPADSDLPFNLDGWISEGTGNEYDGSLTKNGKTVEAWNGRREQNQIQR